MFWNLCQTRRLPWKTPITSAKDQGQDQAYKVSAGWGTRIENLTKWLHHKTGWEVFEHCFTCDLRRDELNQYGLLRWLMSKLIYHTTGKEWPLALDTNKEERIDEAKRRRRGGCGKCGSKNGDNGSADCHTDKIQPIADPQGPIDLATYFDSAFVVNLDEDTERWDKFQRRWQELGEPFPVERFSAIRGQDIIESKPDWWLGGPGAWGCYNSHLSIFRHCVERKIKRVCIFEDDAIFETDFQQKVAEYLSKLPADWDCAYLGGQHLHVNKCKPIKVADGVLSPYDAHRTHAYAFQLHFLPTVIDWLTNEEIQSQWRGAHIDHRLGKLHHLREHKIFTPEPWLAGQDEGESRISKLRNRNGEWNGMKFQRRFWHGVQPEPLRKTVIAVVGLHCSGSSALAGMVHKLGIPMGPHLTGFERRHGGGFEDSVLAHLCERCMEFPSTTPKRAKFKSSIKSYLETRGGSRIGIKYPHLCVFLPELQEACQSIDIDLRIISLERPLEESILSLTDRSLKAKPKATPEQCESLQRCLFAERDKALTSIPHLTVQQYQMVDNPVSVIEEICEYLDFRPNQRVKDKAAAHINPEFFAHSRPTAVTADRIISPVG